jgi:ComF family protein
MNNTPYWIYKQVWKTLDWVFPPSCGGCGSAGEKWCLKCQGEVRRITGNLCPLCGRETRNSGKICSLCSHDPPEYSALRSYGYFTGPLRNAIHRLKYQRDIGLGAVFGSMLSELIMSLEWQADLVVPVPLSKNRLAQRGYNQAAIIAYPLAMMSKMSYVPQAVVRTRDTRSQVDLNREERKLNVAGAFKARPKYINGKSIMLVDDVATTGSTLAACTRALTQAGAKDVYCLTLARALDYAGQEQLSGKSYQP